MRLAVPSILLTLAVVVQAATVDPPPASRGNPSDLIGTDVDLISHPDLNNTVCPELKALRQSCYEQAKAKQSFEYENQCLCSPDVAYAVSRCASGQYSGLDNKQEKAAYYQDFLYYTYDCYCVAGQVDVTYNATARPVEPYVKGWTGDAILPPPAGTCPTKRDDTGRNPDTGTVKTPVPPCNCKPPNPNPPVLPCPDGYTRCSGKCVPVPTPCAKCDWPYTQAKGDCTKCICSPPYVENNGKCEKPQSTPCTFCCKPNELLVRGCFSNYCSCLAGYERCGGNCVAACGKGETRQKDCSCSKPCTGGKVPDWKGGCVCPWGTKENSSGNCAPEAPCKPNQLYDDYNNICYCPRPDFAYDAAGNCERRTCQAWDATCYPRLSEENYVNETTAVITSSPPAETIYAQTVLSEGATPIITELAETTIDGSGPTATTGSTGGTEPTPTSDSSSEEAGPTDTPRPSADSSVSDGSTSDAPEPSSSSSNDPSPPEPIASSGSSSGGGGGYGPGDGGSGTGSSGGDGGSGGSDSGSGSAEGSGGSGGSDGGGSGAAPAETPSARLKRRSHARHF